jgi:hypothetical protein
MKSGCMEHTVREVIDIELSPDNMNREGFSLSRSWKPHTQILKGKKKIVTKDK